MRKIMLVAVFCVLGFALLGQAQGHLFLRIDHKDTALEIGGYSISFVTHNPEVCIALFSKFGEFSYDWWGLDDIRDLKDSLSQYLATSNKSLTCIYPPDEYVPQYFQVLGLGDTVLIRDVCYYSNHDHFIAMKLSLDEARKVADALSAALTLAEKP
jgi:hypothetical protein